MLERPFALWRDPGRLPEVLHAAADELGPARNMAVTMTAELADCFGTKREGVAFVLDAFRGAFPEARPLGLRCRRALPLDRSGPPPSAPRRRRQLDGERDARGRRVPDALFIDVGSTTTDVIPIVAGGVAARGKTDPDRLRTRRAGLHGGAAHAGLRDRALRAAAGTPLPRRRRALRHLRRRPPLAGTDRGARLHLRDARRSGPQPAARLRRAWPGWSAPTWRRSATTTSRRSRITSRRRRCGRSRRAWARCCGTCPKGPPAGHSDWTGSLPGCCRGEGSRPRDARGRSTARARRGAHDPRRRSRLSAGRAARTSFEHRSVSVGRARRIACWRMDDPDASLLDRPSPILADAAPASWSFPAADRSPMPCAGPARSTTPAPARRTGWRSSAWTSTRSSWRACSRRRGWPRGRMRSASAVADGRLAVLAPFRWLRAADPLPHGWHVTSDSIAAWVAARLAARRLVLLKSLEGAPGPGGRPAGRDQRGRGRGGGHRGRILRASAALRLRVLDPQRAASGTARRAAARRAHPRDARARATRVERRYGPPTSVIPSFVAGSMPSAGSHPSAASCIKRSAGWPIPVVIRNSTIRSR